MTDAIDIVTSICEKYQAAVSANDSDAYRQLFAEDAIRIPPGSEPEYGPEKIAQSEQKDYDVARWTIQSVPIDALCINDEWIYGIAKADVNNIRYADSSETNFTVIKTWLLHKSDDGEWRIKRQMWTRTA